MHTFLSPPPPLITQLTSPLLAQPIKLLSDGLKTRLVFCEISLQNPHLLLFDEPTNAADMEMIDSMAEVSSRQ